MNYNQAIHFIGKCLTLNQYPEKTSSVKSEIGNNHFNWYYVIEVSSNQYVLPSFYVSLKKAGLQHLMPSNLEKHLAHLTGLNKERNINIINEAFDICKALNHKGILPIFLKGTALLLEGFYKPSERMVGDIDLLVSPEEMFEASEVLMQQGYEPLIKFDKNIHRNIKHFPRLIHQQKVAAVEIHREVLHEKHQKKFGYSHFYITKRKFSEGCEYFLPSFENLVYHNMLHTQLNDKAYLKRIIVLRQMNDIYKLTEKANVAKVLQSEKNFKKYAQSWLAVCFHFFDKPDCLKFTSITKSNNYVKQIEFFQNHHRMAKIWDFTIFFTYRLKRYISLPFFALFNKSERKGLITRLKNPNWYKLHFNIYAVKFRDLF